MRQINIAMDAYSIVVSIILAIYLFRRSEKSKRIVYFQLVCIFNLLMILGDLTDWTCRGTENALNAPLLHIGTFINYLSAAPLQWLMAQYVLEYIRSSVRVARGYDIVMTALCILYLLGCVLTPFTGMYYIITPDNQYVRGDWFLFSQAIPFMMYAVLALITLQYRKYFTTRTLLCSISYMCIPLLAQLVQIPHQGLNVLCPAITLGILMCFVNIQIDDDVQRQVDRQQLMTTQISVLLSQIRPHFMYNALNTIRRLCDTNPQQARNAIDEFSIFLRANMSSLASDAPIPFEQELRHTQSYLRLEQERFGDELKIVYDIHARDFTLPALTLQPIVENAVKHGIRKKQGGGTVEIRTRESDTHFIIAVSDNGAGFDPRMPLDDDRPHIGMRNVEKRLELLCQGSLQVHSEPGSGSIVTMLIPKEKQV